MGDGEVEKGRGGGEEPGRKEASDVKEAGAKGESRQVQVPQAGRQRMGMWMGMCE